MIILIALRTFPEKTIWSFCSIHNIFTYRTISNYRLSIFSNIIIIRFIIIGVFAAFIVTYIKFCLSYSTITLYKLPIMTSRTFNKRFSLWICRKLMMLCIVNICIYHASNIFQKRIHVILTCFNL